MPNDTVTVDSVYEEEPERKFHIRFSTILFIIVAIAACVAAYMSYTASSDMQKELDDLKFRYEAVHDAQTGSATEMADKKAELDKLMTQITEITGKIESYGD